MENLELLRNFDGKALLIGIFGWAALFNAWRALRWKRAWLDVEAAYTELAQENVALRAKRDRRYPDIHFTCAPEMHK